jgi:hypothetical protein
MMLAQQASASASKPIDILSRYLAMYGQSRVTKITGSAF